ncbi:cytochrome bc1 complex cytochrome b subunit [Actinotalea caeni]|uniref:cytochrome bc1 complex cytochrome b subunit n=1 Tax=Actinotalea caeni TaxID=1348467 RepID=UPI0012E2B142|nr:ubiquinol-cytochrome c reductase cytochrome b subunit [Actinotalea caeni]
MTSTTTSAATTEQAVPAPVAATVDYLDRRVGLGFAIRGLARKLFPDHWSFLLGEIALYSFIVLILSGIFLTMFFVPSMAEVHYPENALPVTMQGVEMSEAFASTLNLSFHVRGGLLMRQIHHWAALMFVGSMVVHMLRVFFTGAFRKPRELNWVVGFTMLVLSLLAGLTGYSLPDDVLSGNGLRITDGVVRSIPIIGAYMSYMVFGGEFPGTEVIPRMFTLHILLIPGLILALLALHLFLVFWQKHTQYPGPGRTDKNVVGYPLLPVYTAKAGGFFFIVFGVLALMGATMSINSVWNYGPFDPALVSAGAQPDWYMLFLEGSLRLMPGQTEFVILGWTLSLNVLIPAVVVPGLLFTFLGAYPFVENAITKDVGEHHVLDRPRNAATRTALGTAFLSVFFVLLVTGANDLVATHFGLSLNAITLVLRVLIFVLPVVVFIVTKRVCLSLQRKDREVVLHGHETGIVRRTADGRFYEVHKPLDEYERWVRVGHHVYRPLELPPREDARGVRRPGGRADGIRTRLSRFFFEDRVEPVTPAELAAAQSHGEHDELPAAPEGSSAAELAGTRGTSH